MLSVNDITSVQNILFVGHGPHGRDGNNSVKYGKIREIRVVRVQRFNEILPPTLD